MEVQINHQREEIIRGHVFRSILALVLQGELCRRMNAAGRDAEWADIRRDLNALAETEIEQDGKCFLVRSATRESVAAILRCAGARLPNTLRQVDPVSTFTIMDDNSVAFDRIS